MFALSAQNLMDKQVHQLVMLLAMLLGIFSFAAFFHLIDYASRLLRPISLLAHVGAAGIAVTESIYPKQFAVLMLRRVKQSISVARVGVIPAPGIVGYCSGGRSRCVKGAG